MKKILVVVGTRPNFIKITQFRRVAKTFPGLDLKIVHTGQHFDQKMADIFLEQFSIVPDHMLGVGEGTPLQQMAGIMTGLEKIIKEYSPDLMMVVGDVNSTFAAALAANKTGTRLAHVESGLRSFDRTMPEEFNRLLTDVVADFHFVTEASGKSNLLKEGVEEKRIFFVGNTMIDTMVNFREKIQNSRVLTELNLKTDEFVLMTMHRPATVDNKEGLEQLYALIEKISTRIVFPIHPRTRKMIASFGLEDKFYRNTNLTLTEPLDYFAFQRLITDCKYIITDSGGIQEESTFLQKPCITLRPNTERPVTVTEGTNTLLSFDLQKILPVIESIQKGTYKKGSIPQYWDGKATERIFSHLDKILQ